MPRYVQISPALSTQLPGVSEMEWVSIEFPDSASDLNIQNEMKNLGIGDGFSVSPAGSPKKTGAIPYTGFSVGETSSPSGGGPFGSGGAASAWNKATDFVSNLPDFTVASRGGGVNLSKQPPFNTAPPMGLSSLDMQLSNLVDKRMGNSDAKVQAALKDIGYKSRLDEIEPDEGVVEIVNEAVSLPSQPGTYEVTVTTADGIKETVTVSANNSSEARAAAKEKAEVGSTIGVPKEKTAPVAATESAASAMLGQGSIDIEQFLASIPEEKRFYEAQGIGFENPLVTSLLQLAQTGVTATSNLEIQKLATENATAIAEFTRDADIQIATNRGATDIEVANINSKANISIAKSQEMATRFASEQQRITDKYIADTNAETDKEIAKLVAQSSGAYGAVGPGANEDGSYTNNQLASIRNLLKAEQQGAIDAAAATLEVGLAQAGAASDQAAASKIGMQDNIFSYAAANPEASQQDLANLAGLSPEARMALANVEAAQANADAQIRSVGLQSQRQLDAAIAQGASAEEIAAITTQSENLRANIQAQSSREIAQLQQLADAAIATTQATASTQVATTQAGAITGAANIEAEAAKAIANIQQVVGLDENTKALAIANIETEAAQAIAALQSTDMASATATQAQAASPYGYLAAGGPLTDVQAILSGQYNPYSQNSTDMLNLARAQASGGLTNETNILGVQQAAAATNPYAATQLGQDAGRIDQILRGGLTAEEQRQLTLAGQAGQMQGNYLNYISNPFAVGASQTLSGGTAAPFSQQQLQQMSDSPSGTVPSFAVGLGTSPFALPETQAIGAAQGLPANFTIGDWESLSDVEQQSVSGQLSPYGITPSMIGELAASYAPGSTQAVSSYT